MQKFYFQIEGMSCQHCVMRVKKAISALEGILSVDVHLDKKNAQGSFDESKTSLESIREAIVKTGYSVS